MENPNYYAIIPAVVRYSNITPNAKLLYGEITALSNKYGYCYAGNQYFANLYNVSKTSIVNWINELIDNNFITREIIYEEGTNQVKNRYLKLVDHPIQEILHTPTKNLDHPIQEILHTPTKNLVHNNTLNNTDNITYNNPMGDISNENAITEEKIINQPPAPPRVSAPRVKVGCQLPVQVKSKLVNMDPIAKKALTDYCLYLIETYNFQKTALCNRIDEVCRKSRNIAQSIEAICNYNMNGGYKQCFVPGNLGKVVADAVVVSEQATEEDFVRDENGNIEEDW